MKKFVSDIELRKLILFIRSKGVKYYDLQLELADHFASAIEDKWRYYPDLDFDQEIARLYQEYGDRGFKKMVHAKRQALENQWTRKAWSYYKGFFHFPKLLLPLLLTVLIYQLLDWASSPKQVFHWLGGLTLAVGIATSLILFWKKPVEASILTYDRLHYVLLYILNFAFLFFFVAAGLILDVFAVDSNLGSWGLAILLSTSLLFFYSSIIQLSWGSYQEARRFYARFPIGTF